MNKPASYDYLVKLLIIGDLLLLIKQLSKVIVELERQIFC